MKQIAETERLLLRELTMADFDDLMEILSDPDSMVFYGAPFDADRVKDWIEWSIDSYAKYGCGLWAVVLKETNECIGDCGITVQEIEGEVVRELGYHIKKNHCGNGLATEAALAAKNYGFETLGFEKIVSYMNAENLASRRIAEKNGMRFVKEFEKSGIRQSLYEVTSANRVS